MIVAAGPVLANNDPIDDVLRKVGVYTDAGSAALNKVSQKTEEIASFKITPGGFLGDKAAQLQEKAELLQEKVESKAEKLSKLKERMSWAQKLKESMAAKYEELNKKLNEYKQKAEATLAEGKAIREKYKNYKDKVTNAIDDAKNLKNDLQESVDGLKNMAESQIADISDKTGVNLTKSNSNKQESKPTGTQAEEKPQYNQADAIRSATALAGEVEVENIQAPSVDYQDISGTEQVDISAAEILAVAQKKQGAASESSPVEVQSTESLEDQLIKASNQSSRSVKEKTTKLENTTQIDSSRLKFSAKSTAEERETTGGNKQ